MAAGLGDVRRIALGLPRANEAMVRDYVKFRVGSIVFASVSPDESLLGFGFPREEREALVATNPSTFLMPVDSDLRLMTVWVIRAGKHGEREQWCLENNAAGGGWDRRSLRLQIARRRQESWMTRPSRVRQGPSR